MPGFAGIGSTNQNRETGFLFQRSRENFTKKREKPGFFYLFYLCGKQEKPGFWFASITSLFFAKKETRFLLYLDHFT
jgi:hypothetical protein